MGAERLVLGVEGRILSLPVTPRARDHVDGLAHDQPLRFAVEGSAHGLDPRPAARGVVELGLDGMQLDDLRRLHVLIGILGADDIGAVLLVHALELRVHHAEIAVLNLHTVDARGDATDGHAQARRDEIAGKHHDRQDRERLAENVDLPAMARGTLEGALAFRVRAHAIVLSAGNDTRLHRHGKFDAPQWPGRPASGNKVAAGLCSHCDGRPSRNSPTPAPDPTSGRANGRRDRCRTSPPDRARPGSAGRRSTPAPSPRAPRGGAFHQVSLLARADATRRSRHS